MHDRPCHLIIDYEVSTPPAPKDVEAHLSKGSLEEKIDAMKTLILMILQDEHFPRMIMVVVQNCMRVDDHEMKKLLMLYWEVIEKVNNDGTVKEEMVMLINALRNDLLSPNEYIRARTLRLVSKLRYREILDGLLQPVLECLEHRHPYVRRNAVMCVYSIFISFGDDVIPDAVDRIDGLLTGETDLSTRRNALLFLFEADPTVALKYLNSILLDESEGSSSLFGSSSDILQLIVLEELKKVCKNNPMQKGKYMKSIFALSQISKSQSVLFECANTIVQLTSVTKAVKSALETYIRLLNDASSDNNIKLIVLEKLADLQPKFHRILQDFAVDIIRVINTPSQDIRAFTIKLVLKLLNSRNVEEVVRFLKKELQNAQKWKETANYQELLVGALHKCAVTYPDISSQQGLVELLMDCCVREDNTSIEVIKFLQQLVNGYELLRSKIIEKLHLMLSEIQSPQVCRSALWILAEYSGDPETSIRCILRAIGEGPFVNKRERKQQMEKNQEGEIHRTIVLPDGTYGTQVISKSDLAAKPKNFSGIRRALTENNEVDFFLLTSLAIALTKLVKKVQKLPKLTATILLTLCALIQVRTYPRKFSNEKVGYCDMPYSIDPDNYERVLQCIQTITELSSDHWLTGGASAFGQSLKATTLDVVEETEQNRGSAPDDLIVIKQLKGREGINDLDFSEDDAFKSSFFGIENDFQPTLGQVRQLTGLGDPVYVECIVKVQAYDVILEFTLVNRTKQTLSNLTLELASQGDLRVVDRPPSLNLAAGEQTTMKASIKVSSTEAGIIFGNVTYDAARGGNLKVLTLNEVSIDAGEYIYPGTCTDHEFSKKWSEYTWETKIPVSIISSSLMEYTKKLSQRIGMSCITPENILRCSESFLVANFYAKSKFNEDVLMNLSVEMEGDRVVGTIRVRAKTKGMAECLAVKFTILQQNLGSLG